MKYESADIFGENDRAREQQEDSLKEGYHFDNLFDQNEDGAGEKINLATGEAIQNDQDIETSHEFSVDEKGKLREIKKEIEKDLATKWLLENGFDEFGNEKPKKAA